MSALSRVFIFYVLLFLRGYKMLTPDFFKFLPYWRDLNKVYYVPNSEFYELLDEIEELNDELVAYWQFDTDCIGNIRKAGTNGNYVEVTTVRVYDSGKDGYNVLVDSQYICDFNDTSTVELWQKNVPLQRIYEILEELKKTQQELYSRRVSFFSSFLSFFRNYTN